jgi:hypothetical protein
MNSTDKIVLKVFLAGILCIGILSPISAQDNPVDYGPMVTDRPDATEAPRVVPIHHLQVETGGFYETFEGDTFTFDRYVYNTTLLRYGLLKNLELRLGWNLEEQTTSINNSNLQNTLRGVSPLLLGVKVAIAEEKAGMPEIGVIGHIFLPFTAGADFKPETTGVDFRFAFSHTLNEKENLSYNIGAQWREDSPEVAYIYSLSYGYAITDKFGAYAEIYGNFPENSRANHLWDIGGTFLLQPNIQFDITAGSSFTQGQDILLSAGVSFRIPN